MKNDGWVRWSQWYRDGGFSFGQMPLCTVQPELQKFEKEAHRLLKETGADHVLYGVKEYDRDGELEEVRFYLEPMNEDEFEERVVKKSAGLTVYALHARK